MRFENTYLPLTQWATALFILVSGWSPAKSFHTVTAGFYVLGPLTLFGMALLLSRKLLTSFIAAAAYSCLSISTLLIPLVRIDTGGPLNLRRLQSLVFYGEAPHTVVLSLLPIAVMCCYLALTRDSVRWKVLAGISAAAIALTNAFGIVALLYTLLSLVLCFCTRSLLKSISILALIGTLSYLWICPWLSPTMIQAIRINSPTVDGDYRYTMASWFALAILFVSYGLIWWGLRRIGTADYLQFFVLIAYVPSFFVLSYLMVNAPVIAQPVRYHLQMDMTVILALIFCGAMLRNHLSKKVSTAFLCIILTGLSVQTRHVIRYGRSFIRSVEASQLVEYRIAKWMTENRPGQKAFISGSSAYWYNIFSDNPQFHASHDPSTQNTFLKIPVFSIHSGMNAGDQDAQYSLAWLKAFGARAISVSGPNGQEYYKPIVNSKKFDGLLSEIWRDGDDVIYEIPSRSSSLAHVIPSSAVVSKKPIHGLDTEPIQPFLAALDDPQYPVASMNWEGLSHAVIQATLKQGQVIAVQITDDPGWEATIEGKQQNIQADAIGQMIIQPDCIGDCTVSLTFTGGSETVMTRAFSIAAMLVTILLIWWDRKQSQQKTFA